MGNALVDDYEKFVIIENDEDDMDETNCLNKNNVYSIFTGDKIALGDNKRNKKIGISTKNGFKYPIKKKEQFLAVQEYMKNKPRDRYDTNFRDYIILSVGCNIGLRCGDLLSLKYGHILDRNREFRKSIEVIEQKVQRKNKTRLIVYNDKCIQYFRELFEHYNINVKDVDMNDYIFKSRQSNHLTRQAYDKVLNGYGDKKGVFNECIELGILDNLPYATHTLRKTFAWNLYVESGYDIVLVSKTLGHNDVLVTMSYLNITDEDIVEAYNKVNL